MNQEPKIMSLFSRLVDLLLLNVLFLVTSLPVITLGASLTALFSVSHKLVLGEESYVYRDYFHAFRTNFRLGTAGFLIFSAAGALLGANIWISFHSVGAFFLFLRTLAFLFLALAGICFLYYFPVLAHFQFTWKQVWIHIPHMIITQPASFATLILLNVPVIFLCMYSVYTCFFVLIVGLIIGCAGFAYIESQIFARIFKPYELH